MYSTVPNTLANHELIFSDYFVDDSAFTFRILLLNPRLSPGVNLSRIFGGVFVNKVVYCDKTWRFCRFQAVNLFRAVNPLFPVDNHQILVLLGILNCEFTAPRFYGCRIAAF